MASREVDRRTFITSVAGSAALAAVPGRAAGSPRRGVAPETATEGTSQVTQNAKPRIRFAVIGINHPHINSQVGAVLRGGGELVWLFAK